MRADGASRLTSKDDDSSTGTRSSAITRRFGGSYAGTVSSTLEYAYAGWTVARVAAGLGKQDDVETLATRNGFWQNAIDQESSFARRRSSDGQWMIRWNPGNWDGFYQGNAWSCTWYVPHDVAGLVEHIGEEAFTANLETFTSGFTYPGNGERFNQYWHGNQPVHHVPYPFNYIGRPTRTQELVQDIMNDLYRAEPGGIYGNEDTGQMSAWYVMSAMGISPVTPTTATYAIEMPAFETVEVDLPDRYAGESFSIVASGPTYETSTTSPSLRKCVIHHPNDALRSSSCFSTRR